MRAIFRRTPPAAAALIATLVAAAGCRYFAVAFAPKKTARASDTALAREADALFHRQLASGAYDGLPESLRLLTAAYLENPRDPKVSFLLGMAHLWKVSERGRLPKLEPTITDDLILADKYLSEARRLNPADARVPGFEGAVKMALGSIHQDAAMTRDGYFTLKDGMKRYPEFNLFTMSFVLSNAPRGSARFTEAIDDAWKNLDLCVGRRIERTPAGVAALSAGLRRGMSASGQIAGGSGDRACRNPPSVPHNMEGFFLHMGDLVVKQGDFATAREIYGLARLSPGWDAWPYAAVLEKRIADAEERARAFAAGQKPPPQLMFESAFACTGCHQTRAATLSAIGRGGSAAPPALE